MQLLFPEELNNFKFDQMCKKLLIFIFLNIFSTKIYSMINLIILIFINLV
jgi:hypothetical protein